MTIKELQNKINLALTDFSREHNIEVVDIEITRNYEYGIKVPVSYEVELRIK